MDQPTGPNFEESLRRFPDSLLSSPVFKQLAYEAIAFADEHQIDVWRNPATVDELTNAFISFYTAVGWEDDIESLEGWRNHFGDAYLSKKWPKKAISPESLQGATSRYLSGQLRSSSFDRSLIDALIGQTLLAFIDEVAGFRAVIMRTLVWGGIPFFAFLATELFSDDPNWAAPFIAMLIVFGLILIPWAWPPSGHYRRYREMKRVYQLLTGRSVSVREVRRRAERAADRGVVWFPELYALLDDVEERTKVL